MSLPQCRRSQLQGYLPLRWLLSPYRRSLEPMELTEERWLAKLGR
jgi:hypothetical protein